MRACNIAPGIKLLPFVRGMVVLSCFALPSADFFRDAVKGRKLSDVFIGQIVI
jgi:hypothetical protein